MVEPFLAMAAGLRSVTSTSRRAAFMAMFGASRTVKPSTAGSAGVVGASVSVERFWSLL